MNKEELAHCRLVLEKYSNSNYPLEPNKLGLKIQNYDLNFAVEKLILFGLLKKSSTPGFGSFDKFEITRKGINALAVGLRVYLLKNEFIKARNLFDSWMSLNDNQKITIIGIIIASATAITIAYFFRC